MVGAVPANKELLAGTVLANKELLAGTVPANNLFLKANKKKRQQESSELREGEQSNVKYLQYNQDQSLKDQAEQSHWRQK